MAVFGDFLAPGSEHIAAAVAVTDLPEPAACGAVHELARIVGTLSRYLDDTLPARNLSSPPIGAGQAQALASAREAMRRASTGLTGAQITLYNAAVDRSHPAVQHLSAASGYLAAGRDLLTTHFTQDPSGAREPNSYCAPVITSAPLTSALELARIGVICGASACLEMGQAQVP